MRFGQIARRTQTSLAAQWACAYWAGRNFWYIAEGSEFNPWTEPNTPKSLLFEFKPL